MGTAGDTARARGVGSGGRKETTARRANDGRAIAPEAGCDRRRARRGSARGKHARATAGGEGGRAEDARAETTGRDERARAGRGEGGRRDAANRVGHPVPWPMRSEYGGRMRGTAARRSIMGTGSERKRARSRGYGDGRYTRRHARDTGAAGRRRHAAKGEGWKRGGHVNKTIRSNGQRNAKCDTGNRSYTDAQRIRNNSRELPHTHKRIRNTTISVHVNTGHSSDSTHVRHSTGPLSAQEEEATQHMKHATPCGMEYWPTLGIATAQKQQPATFAAWIQRGKHADPETHRSRARAQGLMKEWHMDRVMTKNQQTVVCIARARRGGWRSGVGLAKATDGGYHRYDWWHSCNTQQCYPQQ